MSEWSDGWTYNLFLQDLANVSGNLTPLELANSIVNAYATGEEGSIGDTQSSIDFSQTPTLSTKIDNLAKELACAVDNGYSTQINNARNNAFEVNGSSPYYNQIDLYEWYLKNEKNKNITTGIYIVTFRYNGKTINKKIAIIK